MHVIIQIYIFIKVEQPIVCVCSVKQGVITMAIHNKYGTDLKRLHDSECLWDLLCNVPSTVWAYSAMTCLLYLLIIYSVTSLVLL